MKLLPNLVCLGHVGDNWANVVVLNNGLIIFLKVFVLKQKKKGETGTFDFFF